MSVHGVSSASVNLLVGLTLVTRDAALADPSVQDNAITDTGSKSETFDTKHAGSSSVPTESRPTEFRVEFETNTQAFNASKMFCTSEAVMSAKTNSNSNATEIRLH